MTVIVKKDATKAEFQKLLDSLPFQRPKFDARRFLGTVKVSQSPMDTQRKLRDEWK